MKTNYPQIIQQIHSEFNSASDKLLKEAKEILNKKDFEKAKRLNDVGFVNTREVNDLSKLKDNANLISAITYYQEKYANNKFITEEQVEIICKKYKLICAPIEKYKGFVPNKNLKEIETFNNHYKYNSDLKVVALCKSVVWYYSGGNISHLKKYLKKMFPKGIPETFVNNDKIHVDDLGKRFWANSASLEKKEEFLICAPKKDLNLKGLKRNGSFFSKISEAFETENKIIDPVVLRKVNEGFLVVTAWGNEASDEIVVNQKMN